jgi:cytochrome P450
MLPPGPAEPRVVQALRYVYRYHDLTADQHRRHGASYTLRLPGLPDSVVTADRELIKHLLTGDPLKRRHANDVLAPALGTGSVMLQEPAAHLERRKALLPPFHGERIAAFRDVVHEIVERDLEGWHGTVGVHERARALTLAIIQRLVLGTEDRAFAAELTGLLDTFASPAANFGLFAPAFSRRSRWNVLAERYWKERDKLDALMAKLITATRTDPALDERTDVLAMLVQAGDISDADLNDELKTLLAAGHETTATAIAWAADVLAHRPEAQAAIREGDRAYLTAAAKELLRLRTITPVSAGRELLEPVQTGPYDLPVGTVVLIDAATLHADPDLHPDPQAFRPERFSNGGPPPYSYLPFGGGAHRCLGSALANLELEVAMGAIVERFELEPTGPPEAPARRGVTMVPAKGAPVRVRPR